MVAFAAAESKTCGIPIADGLPDIQFRPRSEYPKVSVIQVERAGE